MLENPKINKDLIYDYRGSKQKLLIIHPGWNSVFVSGQNNRKIGPILAINNNDEFTDLYVAEKKLIENIPKGKKYNYLLGLQLIVKK